MTVQRALIADIGGTNARFGLVDKDGLHELVNLEGRNYAGITEAAEDYLKMIGIPTRPTVGVFAIAGPVLGDLVSFTNLSWSFRGSKVKSELGLSSLEIMNDFKAVALGVPGVSNDLLHHLAGPDAPMDGEAKGIIGPGTGLGVASLLWTGNRYLAQAGEGGHVTMPATSQREFDIFRQLHVKYHHISAERVCSGKGLENLYNAIRVLDKKDDKPDLTAPEISAKAMSGECEVAKESLDLMLAFLGRVAGNLALTLNAHGGVYIAGGIPTKLGNYFLESRFVEEFQAKGRMSDLMKTIPVYMVKHEALGLLGLERHAQFSLG